MNTAVVDVNNEQPDS